MSSAFEEGRAARMLGLPITKNPYAAKRHEDSRFYELASEWESGWAWPHIPGPCNCYPSIGTVCRHMPRTRGGT